jgi:hypothetical protein
MAPSKWIAIVLASYLSGFVSAVPTGTSEFVKRAAIDEVSLENV